MLRAKRDRLGGEPGKAIPSLGEIEGRMMILELVAVTALTRLLRLHDPQERSALMEALRHAVDRKCRDAKLSGADISSAEKYAEELLKSAQEQAEDLDAIRDAST
ncbi:hypothetical protein SAMN02927900_05992 [Rhizobium mongolense subsp. loessense]|uniref:Uncharacterized protein n=1 Tax=Rhizobium mongolense subsp. loessense TaxID=158890 RepID=A0A1G4U4G2_9HYPH|nr:hypothetical protein [Rhizobium mongolense]SCW87669.1 hypothetical protein SAMN02927900_05992 [Rhizobium mongolense subsp. loessense]